MADEKKCLTTKSALEHFINGNEKVSSPVI